jgi:hypothetical protein
MAKMCRIYNLAWSEILGGSQIEQKYDVLEKMTVLYQEM